MRRAALPADFQEFYDMQGADENVLRDNVVYHSRYLNRICMYTPTALQYEPRLVIAIKGALLSISNVDLFTLADALIAPPAPIQPRPDDAPDSAATGDC